MKDDPKPASLYPSFDTLDDVVSEAKTRLPISTENQLITVIQMTYNTAININEAHHIYRGPHQ